MSWSVLPASNYLSLKCLGCTAINDCPSSYKLGHKVGLSYGGSGSSVGLIMQPAFDVASGVVGLSVS